MSTQDEQFFQYMNLDEVMDTHTHDPMGNGNGNFAYPLSVPIFSDENSGALLNSDPPYFVPSPPCDESQFWQQHQHTIPRSCQSDEPYIPTQQMLMPASFHQAALYSSLHDVVIDEFQNMHMTLEYSQESFGDHQQACLGTPFEVDMTTMSNRQLCSLSGASSSQPITDHEFTFGMNQDYAFNPHAMMSPSSGFHDYYESTSPSYDGASCSPTALDSSPMSSVYSVPDDTKSPLEKYCESFQEHRAQCIAQIEDETHTPYSTPRRVAPRSKRGTVRKSPAARPRGVRKLRTGRNRAQSVYTPVDSADESDTETSNAHVQIQFYSHPLKPLEAPLKYSVEAKADGKSTHKCMEHGCIRIAYQRLEHLERHFMGHHLGIGNLFCLVPGCKLNRMDHDENGNVKASKGIRPDNMDQHFPTHVMDCEKSTRRNDKLTLAEAEAIFTEFCIRNGLKAEVHIKRLRRNVFRRRIENTLKGMQRQIASGDQKKKCKDAVEASLEQWIGEPTQAGRTAIVEAIALELWPSMAHFADSKKRECTAKAPFGRYSKRPTSKL